MHKKKKRQLEALRLPNEPNTREVATKYAPVESNDSTDSHTSPTPNKFDITDLLVMDHAKKTHEQAKKLLQPLPAKLHSQFSQQAPHKLNSAHTWEQSSPEHGFAGLDGEQDARGDQSEVSIAQQQEIDRYVRDLKTAENTDLFAYSSALCHRVTGKYLPKARLAQDAELQKKEISRLHQEPELVKAIETIQRLSHQFKRLAHDQLGHRDGLGPVLFRIEEAYLRLFEHILEVSLRMYWKYEQQHESEREYDKKSLAYWKDKQQQEAQKCIHLKQIVASKEILIRTKEIEAADVQKLVQQLQHEVVDQQQNEQEIRDLKLQKEYLVLEKKQLENDIERQMKLHEVIVQDLHEKQEEMRQQHELKVEHMKETIQDKEQLIRKQAHELIQKQQPIIIVKPPTPKEVVVTVDQQTQTEVDENGLWDIKDGVPAFVSKDLQRRMHWRRFDAFVRCKNCHGRPIQHSSQVQSSESAEVDEAYVDVWSVVRGQTLSKKAAKKFDKTQKEWKLPAPLLLFLANLPKSVVAFPFYTMEQVIAQIEELYDDKFASDQVDSADGVATEAMTRFVCEFFLKRCGMRQSAEVALYRFLISAKLFLHESSHIRLFARFLDLLQDQEQVPADPKGDQLISMHQQRNGFLDRRFLRVFLHARHLLVKKPERSPLRIHDKHLIQVDARCKWVPLDHAVYSIKWLLSYMEEHARISYCREMEHNTAFFGGNAIQDIGANRLVVRSEMRHAMLKPDPPVIIAATACDAVVPVQERSDPHEPCVVVDVHKTLLLLMNALEYRRKEMETDLINMFERADVNRDRVLSLEEFTQIIRSRAPHFSDRRILRMFREALMGGSDQSFALSLDAFINVCDDHGLVSLLPEELYQDPFEMIAQRFAGSKKKMTNATKVTRDAKVQVPETEEIPEEIQPETAPQEEDQVEEDLWTW